MRYTFGLDLGQTTDPTAGVILEAMGEGAARLFRLSHIEEFSLRTSYPQVIDTVKALLARAPLQGACTLVIDQTGVGRAIFDMFVEAGLAPIGITITTGKVWHQEAWNQYSVAKELLVGVVQKYLQSERLQGSWRVKHSRLLKRELQSFRVKITKAANEQYGPDVRESAHDDIVLATSCALWHATYQMPAIDLSQNEIAQLQAQARRDGLLPREPSHRALWSRRPW